MGAIEKGTGAKPKPFMRAKEFKADAVWQSKGSRSDPVGDKRGVRENTAKPDSKPVKVKAPVKAKKVSRMPTFVEPQLCKLVDQPPSGAGWVHEVKFDGYRMQLRVQDGKAKLLTRKGLDWTAKFPAIAKVAAKLPDCIIDGEICALDDHGAPDFAGLQAALSDGKTEPLIFFAFDLLFVDGEDLRPLPLTDRKARLQPLLKKHDTHLRFVEHFTSGGDAILLSACRMHLEGIVSKRADAPYRSGRGDTWTKAKCRAGHEVVIGGWSTTAGKFRSLPVGVHRGDHLSGAVANRDRDGSQSELNLLVDNGVALATDKCNLLKERLGRGNGARGERLQREVLHILLKSVLLKIGEQHSSHGRRECRQSGTDVDGHRHDSGGMHAGDVDDVVTVEQRERR